MAVACPDVNIEDFWPLKELKKALINPNNAIEIISVGLFFENTLLTLLRLQSLAYGFETFA